MKQQQNKPVSHIIIDIIIIVILILMPGIRGYDNYAWYEYLVFVFIPVVWFINDIIQQTKK